jgi:hypothetical protein
MAPDRSITFSNLASQPTGISFRFPSHPLKAYLVLIGLRALSDGDRERVELVTRLIRERGPGHG